MRTTTALFLIVFFQACTVQKNAAAGEVGKRPNILWIIDESMELGELPLVPRSQAAILAEADVGSAKTRRDG